MSAAVEIYTRPGCGYCSAAKALLKRKQVGFTEFDAGKNPAFRKEMLARANGGTTFPQIFVDGFHVGGCDDLYALDDAGKLDALLNGEKEAT
jgi:glutaredoxin 3